MVKKVWRVSILLLLLLALCFPAISNSASAVEGAQNQGNGFRISPVRYELIVEKGKSNEARMEIENPTNIDINAVVIVNDFEVPDDESGNPKILIDSSKVAIGNSFKSIVSTDSKIFLPKNSRASLKVKINVPKNGQAGGYYGVIRVEPQDIKGTNVMLTASAGTIFLVTVPGNLTEQLNLVDLTAAKNDSSGRIFINSGAMSVVTRLKNTGNIHVKPFGKIQVTDSRGKLVQEINFNETEPRANVLPNSTRKFNDKLIQKNWLGKYTITANLGYGTSGSLITAKSTFWVIPLWLVVTAMVVLFVLVVGGYLIYRRHVNNKKKHHVHRRR